jgi:hypothetical protein
VNCEVPERNDENLVSCLLDLSQVVFMDSSMVHLLLRERLPVFASHTAAKKKALHSAPSREPTSLEVRFSLGGRTNGSAGTHR